MSDETPAAEVVVTQVDATPEHNTPTPEDLEAWSTRTADRIRADLLPQLEELKKRQEELLSLLTEEVEEEDSAPIDAVPAPASSPTPSESAGPTTPAEPSPSPAPEKPRSESKESPSGSPSAPPPPPPHASTNESSRKKARWI